MAYTEFKFDPVEIQDLANKTRNEYLSYDWGTGESPEVFGVRMMAENLEKNPRRYLAFGPYWWALKELLIRHGRALGETMDYEIAREYRGGTDYQTLVIAEQFSEFYHANYFVGANSWHLDPDAVDDYILYDPDYERAAAERGL